MVSAMSRPGDVQSSLVNDVQANLSGMRVTPENVLQIRNALLAESMLMAEKVRVARQESVVGEPGLDPVSIDLAPQFNTKITGLLDQWQAYVKELQTGAKNLERMAKEYGHGEQQIRDSFSRFQIDNPPPVNPAPLVASPAPTPPQWPFPQLPGTAGPGR